MKIERLVIDNFRGIKHAELHFTGHTLLVGSNNVGKSTICEALDLVLGPDRMRRNPIAQEHDFYNAKYYEPAGESPRITIEVILTNLNDEVQRLCRTNLEFWHRTERRVLGAGELEQVDGEDVTPCLRLIGKIQYDSDEDDFVGETCFAVSPRTQEGEDKKVSSRIKQALGFLYLRALRTGSRALTLERGSLLDLILRLKEVRPGLWEETRVRLRDLTPPIDETSPSLKSVLKDLEARIGTYISVRAGDRATRLHVTRLTREHLRSTLSFFLSMAESQEPVPFHLVGSGTVNTLVLALLSFIADEKKNDVIFAMEEPEIALPPHTQHRIVRYLLSRTAQCFVSSHSPYVIECFRPEEVLMLQHDEQDLVTGRSLQLPDTMKAKMYRSQLRRGIAEAILGSGVVVCEGISDARSLQMIARRLEEAEPSLTPLDVAGISIFSTDGDGNLSGLGAFFGDLGLKRWAIYDKKNRPQDEEARIQNNFDTSVQIPYRSLESLLAAEVACDEHWRFLESVRDDDTTNPYGIPAARPSDDDIRRKAREVLSGLKGEVGAERLLEQCPLADLPTTLVSFLRSIYAVIPRPPEDEPTEAEPAREGGQAQVEAPAPATP